MTIECKWLEHCLRHGTPTRFFQKLNHTRIEINNAKIIIKIKLYNNINYFIVTKMYLFYTMLANLQTDA